jgi:single-stranded-DNA-specific exonuclease
MVWKFLSEKTFQPETIHTDLLALRGLPYEQFLGTEGTAFHSPWLMHDMKSAVEVIGEAISKKKKIFIHGDYDVDGVCATAILWDALYRTLGADVMPYIPDRFDEGYGLSKSSVEAMRAAGAQLIITVDCGIRDQELIAANADLDFVITDHHALALNEAGEPAAPAAARAVVHPRHPAGKYPFVEICGAMVAWKLAWGLSEHMKVEFDQDKYLDLLALATVCDVMPVIDENRTAIRQGLKQFARTQHPGVAALLEIAGLGDKSELECYHLGYLLGPRINAAGRIDSAMTALKLLTTKDAQSGRMLAMKLNQLNLKRQQLSMDLQQEAKAQAPAKSNLPIHVVSGNAWPEGILGLVAGKLSEQYYRPVIALSIDDKTGLAVGSARSIPQFNIVEALQSLSKYLVRFGGHAQAAGLTIKASDIADFTQDLTVLAEAQLAGIELEQELTLDGVLEPGDVTLDTFLQVSALAPFGEGHPLPKFALMNMQIVSSRALGKEGKHAKLWLRSSKGKKVVALAFNMADRLSEISTSANFDIAGSLQSSTWQGETTVEIKLDDLRESV